MRIASLKIIIQDSGEFTSVSLVDHHGESTEVGQLRTATDIVAALQQIGSIVALMTVTTLLEVRGG